jgi:hypothetical protein
MSEVYGLMSESQVIKWDGSIFYNLLKSLNPVTPAPCQVQAPAGNHLKHWIPVSTGMTKQG